MGLAEVFQDCAPRMGISYVLLLLVIAGIADWALSATASRTITALYVFGDSYADTGNGYGDAQRDSYTFRHPYGITWPGYPTGRASSGHVLTDYLATETLGLTSPTPFLDLSNGKVSISDGINFALVGAGMTYAYGVPTIGTQVAWFESLVNAGNFSSRALESSVVVLCNAGNDYGAFNGSLQTRKEIVALTDEVVQLMEESLLRLYRLGVRNMIVTTLAPLNCLPGKAALTNYTACSRNGTIAAVNSRHDQLLLSLLVKLEKQLPGVNFVLLHLGEAMKLAQKHIHEYNITQPYKECCVGECGRVDSVGIPLYTVCDVPESHFFWDNVHPTETGWKLVVDLYLKHPKLTSFAPSLQQWVRELS